MTNNTDTQDGNGLNFQSALDATKGKKSNVDNNVQEKGNGQKLNFDAAVKASVKKKEPSNDTTTPLQSGTKDASLSESQSTLPLQPQNQPKTTNSLKTDVVEYINRNRQAIYEGAKGRENQDALKLLINSAISGDASALKKVDDYFHVGISKIPHYNQSERWQESNTLLGDQKVIAEGKKLEASKPIEQAVPVKKMLKDYAMSSIISQHKKNKAQVDPIAIAEQYEKTFYGDDDAARRKEEDASKVSSIVRQNKGYRLESDGINSLYDYELAELNDLKSQYEKTPNDELKNKIDEKSNELSTLANKASNLYNKYPQVAQQKFNRLIKDDLATNKTSLLPHFYTSESDVDEAVKRISETNPNFTTNFEKQIKKLKSGNLGLFNNDIGSQGLVDALRRGSFGIVKDVARLFLTREQKAAMDIMPEYLASELPTSFSARDYNPKIVLGKDGKTFVEAKNDLSTTFNNFVNFVGEAAPSIVEFAALEGLGQATKLGTVAARGAKLGETWFEGVDITSQLTSKEAQFANELNKTVGLVGAQYGMSYLKNYDDAYYKYNPKNAKDLGTVKTMAHLYTLSEALAFKAMGITPNELITGSLKESVGNDIYKFLSESDLSKITSKELSEKMYSTWKDKIPALLKASGVESAKMGGVNIVQQAFKDGIDKAFLPDAKTASVEQYTEAFKSGAALGGVFGLIGNLRNYGNISPATGEILYDLGSNSDKYSHVIEQGVKEGTFTQERANELMKVVNTSKKAAIESSRKVYNDGTELKDSDRIKLSKNLFKEFFLNHLSKQEGADKERIQAEQESLKADNEEILSNSPNLEVKTEINPETLEIEKITPITNEESKSEAAKTQEAEPEEPISPSPESEESKGEVKDHFDGLSHVQSAAKLLSEGVIDEAKHTELVNALSNNGEQMYVYEGKNFLVGKDGEITTEDGGLLLPENQEEIKKYGGLVKESLKAKDAISEIKKLKEDYNKKQSEPNVTEKAKSMLSEFKDKHLGEGGVYVEQPNEGFSKDVVEKKKSGIYVEQPNEGFSGDVVDKTSAEILQEEPTDIPQQTAPIEAVKDMIPIVTELVNNGVTTLEQLQQIIGQHLNNESPELKDIVDKASKDILQEKANISKQVKQEQNGTNDETVNQKEGGEEGRKKSRSQENGKKGDVLDTEVGDGGDEPPTPANKETKEEANNAGWVGIEKAMLGEKVLDVMKVLPTITNNETIQGAINTLQEMADNGSKTLLDAAKEYTDTWHDKLFEKEKDGSTKLDSDGKPKLQKNVGVPTELLGVLGVRQAYLFDMMGKTNDIGEQARIALEMNKVDEVLRAAQNQIGRNMQFLQSLFKIGSEGEVMYRRNILSKAVDETIPQTEEELNKRVGILNESTDKSDIEKAKLLQEAYNEINNLKTRLEEATRNTDKANETISKQDFDAAIKEAEERGKKTANEAKKSSNKTGLPKQAALDIADKLTKLADFMDNKLSAKLPDGTQTSGIAIQKAISDAIRQIATDIKEGKLKIPDIITNAVEFFGKDVNKYELRTAINNHLVASGIDNNLVNSKDSKTIDAERKLAKEYKDLEKERNRQLRIVDELKGKLKQLEDTNKLPERTESEKKKDVPEIEELKNKIAESEQKIKDTESYNKRMLGYQEELNRLSNREQKPNKSKSEKEFTKEESDIRNKIDAERKKWREENSAKSRIDNLEKELQRVKDRKVEEKGTPKEKEYSNQEKDLIEQIKSEKDDWEQEKRMDSLESELDRIKNRKDKEPNDKEKRKIGLDEQAKRDEIESEQKKWDTEKRVEKLNSELQRIKDRKEKSTTPKEKVELSNEEQTLLKQIKDENAVWATEKQYNTVGKLSDIQKEASKGNATAITKEMVDNGMIQRLFDSYLGKGLRPDELLDAVHNDLSKILPNTTKSEMLDAYLRKGDFQQKTRTESVDDIKKQSNELREVANLQRENDMLKRGEEIMNDKSKSDKVNSLVVDQLKGEREMLMQQKKNAETQQQIDDINNHLKTWEKILKSAKFEGNVIKQMKERNRQMVDDALLKQGIKLDRNKSDVIQKNRDVANTHNAKIDELINTNIPESAKKLLESLKIKDVNNVEDLGEKIDRKIREIQTGMNTTDRLSPMYKELKSLKETLSNAKVASNETAKLESAKQKMRGDINKMQRDIAGGRFAEMKSPTQLKIDREFVKLNYERNKIRAEYDKAEERFMYKNKSALGKGFDMMLRFRRGSLVSSLKSTMTKLPASAILKTVSDVFTTNILGLSPFSGGISSITGLEKSVSAQRISWKADMEGFAATLGRGLSSVKVDEAILKKTKEDMRSLKSELSEQRKVVSKELNDLKKQPISDARDKSIIAKTNELNEVDKKIAQNNNSVNKLKVETLLQSTDELKKVTSQNLFDTIDKAEKIKEEKGEDSEEYKSFMKNDYAKAKTAFNNSEFNSNIAFVYQFIGNVWKNRGEQIVQGAHSFEEAMGDFKRMSAADRKALHSTSFGRNAEMVVYGIDTVGRIHAAIKDFSAMKQFVTEYAKATEKALEKKNVGETLAEDEKWVIMNKAYEHGFKGGKYSEKNRTVRVIQDLSKRIDDVIAEKAKGGTDKLNYKFTKGAGELTRNVLLPVLKIPMNIENSAVFKFALGFPLALGRIASEVVKVAKNMDTTSKEAFLDDVTHFRSAFTEHMANLDADYADKIKEGLNKGQVGSALMYVTASMVASGALAYGGVYYPSAQKRKDAYGNTLPFGSVSVNGKVYDNYFLKVLGHLPEFMPVLLGMNYIMAKEKQEKTDLRYENTGKQDKEKSPFYMGVMSDANLIFEESPLRNLDQLSSPENTYEKTNNILGSFLSISLTRDAASIYDDAMQNERDIHGWGDRALMNLGLNFLVNKKEQSFEGGGAGASGSWENK